MLEYEQERFPQNLLQGPKMAINLGPPSSDHWNIVSALILPLTIDKYKQRCEAKWAEQDPEGESAGAEGSPKEAPAPGKALQVVAGGSKAASPTETIHQGERALETVLAILERIHALRLRTLHDVGGMRELEQAAVHTLMAEFTRLQLILGEDLIKSLSALCSELETSSEALLSDLLSVLNLHSGDLAFPRVKELIQKHHQSISMKVNLPLIELEAAKEDLGRFLQGHLHELSSDPRSREVVKELSWTLSSYAHRVREAILVLGIEQPTVFNRVMLGLAMDQPLEAILFPGILDGLSGRLGLMPPGVVDPPTSAREGVSRRWAATLREAVMKTEGRDVNPDQVMPRVVHPGLHQDYDLDFRMQRVDDITPTLTSPMLSGLISSVRSVGRPEVPKGPASPKMEEGLRGHSGVPARPDVPGPSRIGGPMETEGNKPFEQGGSISMQPSLCLTQRMQLPSSYQMMMRPASPLICLRSSLHQKLSWPGARSDPWRTGVHDHLLQRSGPQKKRRRVRILVKLFSPEGCWRKTSSPRDMKSLPRIMTGSRV